MKTKAKDSGPRDQYCGDGDLPRGRKDHKAHDAAERIVIINKQSSDINIQSFPVNLRQNRRL